jgi:DNA-binding transcriptional ArsR family regulator
MEVEARMDRVAARPENGHQARLLRLLRDRGQASRAELGEAVELSKSKVAVELDRLTELGLIEPQGLAASRGGRRSHLVGLAGSLRFVGIDIGATRRPSSSRPSTSSASCAPTAPRRRCTASVSASRARSASARVLP